MRVLRMSTLRICRVLLLSLLVSLLQGCGGPVSRVDLKGGDDRQEADEPVALMVKLTGKLGTVELARCHRTLREAASRGITRVIFLLQNAGAQDDDLTDMQSLFDRVQGGDTQTVAVLGGRVTHGAAALALCCGRTYCLRGAEWGEVVKPDKEWDDLFAADPDQAVAARFDAMREMLQTRLDRRPEKLTPSATRLALAIAGRDIGDLPATVNPERKTRAASDFRFFCDSYFPLTFHLPWSRDHLQVIAKIEQAVLRGGLFAMAMPRGSGKTTICECACIWAVLNGHREFVCDRVG